MVVVGKVVVAVVVIAVVGAAVVVDAVGGDAVVGDAVSFAKSSPQSVICFILCSYSLQLLLLLLL